MKHMALTLKHMAAARTPVCKLLETRYLCRSEMGVERVYGNGFMVKDGFGFKTYGTSMARWSLHVLANKSPGDPCA
jgi:hypothetical protein